LVAKSGIEQKDSYEKFVITLIVLSMITLLIPVVKDPLMKIGVCCYAFVIGRMALWALILNSQEHRLCKTISA
jgi:uncharacterized membrane protein YhhN